MFSLQLITRVLKWSIMWAITATATINVFSTTDSQGYPGEIWMVIWCLCIVKIVDMLDKK